MKRALGIALLLLFVSCGPAPPTPGASLSFAPTLAATPTARSSPTPSPTAEIETPTPSPTYYIRTEGEDVTARIVVKRCVRYLPLVDRWNPDFDLSRELVLAVMAQESHCLQGATDETGAANSLGLMQVIPSSWTTTQERLQVASVNVYWGMRILYLTLHDSERNPDHSIKRALMAYNCGWREDACGTAYAERVLGFWLPYVKEAMGECVEEECWRSD